MTTHFTPDVIVVGAGLAGLVATHELALAGKRVLVLDQENRHNLGGQAWWSLGGLLFVDSPEQRRMGIKDSPELAWQDWQGSAQFDRLGDGTDGPGRGEDFWPQRWAEAYVRFAARARSATTCAPSACARSRSSAGPSAATAAPPATATRCPASTSPGAPARRCVRIFAEPVERGGGRRARHASRSATASTSWSSRTAPWSACAAPCSPTTTRRRGVQSSRDAVGDFEHRAPARRRHERRHRPQPRADASQLADRARRRRTRAPDLRGARPRRRSHAGDLRDRGRDDGQPRPDVGLHRGHPQLGPGVARPRHPDPARPVVDVVRRHGQAARGHVRRARRGLDRCDEADPGHRPRLLVVRADPVDHREGVRPLGLRAEPRHHRQGPGVPRQDAAGEGRPRPGRGLQGARASTSSWPTTSTSSSPG